jgi:deoxyribonuclease-4
MSIAGGLPRAVERAVLHRCDALQIFTKNASQWRGRLLPAHEIDAFRAAVLKAGIGPVVSHASYLINLGTANPSLYSQSLGAMRDEIERADVLGLLGVVLHPGACTAGTRDDALARVADALTALFAERPAGRTMVLLEQTAGQGTSLGSRFEELAAILDRAAGHTRLGVCLDTCHLLAAGYDIASPGGYDRTVADFDRIVGLARLHVIHVNDSRKPLGSRVDRHAHIGEGHIGLDGFRRLVTDPRFAGTPMLLETPKEDRGGKTLVKRDPFDTRNLRTLRRLTMPPAHAPRTAHRR